MKTQNDYHDYPTAFMNEVKPNWEMTPYTGILVLNGTTDCSDDYPIHIFNRTWYGVNEGCDCYGLNLGYNATTGTCSSDQLSAGCQQVAAQAGVNQSYYNEVSYCAKTGGENYASVTRLQSTDSMCPTGYESCSEFTSLQNSICVLEGYNATLCPITDVKVVTYDTLSGYNFDSSNTSSPLYFQSDISVDYTLIYSWQANSLAITNMIASFNIPCLEPDTVTNDWFYGLEVQQNYDCPTVYNNNKTEDTRYTKTDAWSTDVYNVQTASGVLATLEGLPNFSSYVPDPATDKGEIPL
jgi:hypothetical protein